MFRILPETIKNTENYERKVREIKRRTFFNWKKVVKRRYLRNTCLHPNMSDFIDKLINWLIENLQSAQDTEYVDLTEINKKYKAKATGLSVANSLKKIAHKYYHLKLQTSSQILVFTVKNYKSQIKVKENTCTVDITKQDIQSIQQVTVSNSLSEKALPYEND
jgi:hypothetical protein